MRGMPESTETVGGNLVPLSDPAVAARVAALGVEMGSLAQMNAALLTQWNTAGNMFGSVVGEMATNTQQAGQIFHNVAKRMIADLIAVTAKAVFLSIVFSFFPGAMSGKGAMSFGGLLKGGLKGVMGFATGGAVTGPTFAMVGENSSLSNPEVIMPMNKLAGMMGGGGTIVVPVNIDGREVTRVVARRLPGELQRQGLRGV